MKHAQQSSLLEHYHLLTYDILDSTNEEARRLAGGGASHGAVIWAKRQSAGRGRMGREWVSAEGNLFATVLLAPEVALEVASQLSFVAALAVAETMEGILPAPERIACKWPNDVLIGGKKIAGILLESFTTPGLASPQAWVAVGIGINVDSYPEHVLYPATCLREEGVELISAKIVLSRLIHHFITRYDAWRAEGFAPIQRAWTKRAHQLGQTIEVVMGDEQLRGTFKGIDASGQLLLQLPKQKTARAIAAGDVFFREPA